MSAELKKRKSKKQQNQQLDENSRKLTKDEEVIAKYLRFNCPSRKGNLMGMKVNFFIGSKAVDCLMSSKWATGAKNAKIMFSNRDQCKSFLQDLLNKELFHRAVKVYKDQVDNIASGKEITPKNTPENTPKARKRKNENEKQAEPAKVETTVAQATSGDDKSKRKFKLEMHDEQVFLDVNEPYVWIYEPTTTTSIIIGLALVIGAIGICLFPLWPSVVREGVYYVSVAGASFLGVILGLALIKYVLFAFILVITLGKIKFWLLPNLTEDVGFFESFVPLYKLTNTSTTTCAIKEASKEAKRKTSIAASESTGDESDKKKSEEFNKLPLDEQLMSKFEEGIDQDNDDDEEYEMINNEDENLKSE